MSDFSGLTDWLKRIDEQLDDNAKSQLTQRIATKLKQQWSRRIRSQIDPSGAGFVPRKAKSRRYQSQRIKTGAMFIRASRMLKTAYSIHRHTGGLENNKHIPSNVSCIHRHTGGLEMHHNPVLTHR